MIEIVSVLEKAIPAGRSELALTLPQIAVPVQAHEWRVLLPEGPQYRFRASELRPSRQPSPGVLTDRINVGGNVPRPASPLVDERRVSTGATVSDAELEKIPTARDPRSKVEVDLAAKRAKAAFAQEAQGLQQGLVGGVKPLSIAIPETGKLLYLTGVLPPAKVGVELEVKGKR